MLLLVAVAKQLITLKFFVKLFWLLYVVAFALRDPYSWQAVIDDRRPGFHCGFAKKKPVILHHIRKLHLLPVTVYDLKIQTVRCQFGTKMTD